MFKWLRHSDVYLEFNLNPFNWYWLPYIDITKHNKIQPMSKMFSFMFLFARLQIVIDDGSWYDMSFVTEDEDEQL